MATFEIPLSSSVPAFKFSIELEKETFIFDFNWNSRQGKWIVSLYDADELAIVEGIPVFSDHDIFQRFKDVRMPKGFLVFLDTSGGSVDPERDELGDRVKFLYTESTDL